MTEWTNRDKAFDDVVRGIYRVMKTIRDGASASSEKVFELAPDTMTKENDQSSVYPEQQGLLQPDKSSSTYANIDSSSPGGVEIEPVITPEQVQDPFEYTWPTLPPEKFTTGRWYQVSGARRNIRLLVARTEREAWGKLRGRVVIFEGGRTGNIKSLNPWSEFVETDDGEYACRIPDPKHPQATLKAGDPLPARFNGAKVLRADQAFRLLRNGPSLRLVVSSTDELAMIKHSYWIASLRKWL